MPKITTVIFDWAGTTVDYGSFAPVGAFVEVFVKRGIEPTLDEVRKPMGMLKKEHIRTMLEMPRIAQCWQEKYGKPYTEADLDSAYEDYEAALLAVLHRYAEPKPFLLETIQALRDKGIKIGSTTGYNDKMMAIVVPKAAENGYSPDYWCSPDAVGGKGRPFPYMIYENMKALGVQSVEQVMKVGDTIADVLEGKNAGVFTVGIVEGSSELGMTQAEFESLSPQEKQQQIDKVTKNYLDAGADQVILNLSQLTDLL